MTAVRIQIGDAMTLSELKPTERARLMDLVAEAGINVSDWANFSGIPAANPKYCYEWSFVKPDHVVALTLWHDKMKEEGGRIFILNCPRKFGQIRGGIERARAKKADAAIQLAFRGNLPVRVIILGGDRRDDQDFTSPASKVKYRRLDPVEWRVTKYDPDTGDSTLTRGGVHFVDQFSIAAESVEPVLKKQRVNEVYERSAAVREQVLRRAKGKCEFCGLPGFLTANGGVYLETHHVVPLCEQGIDHPSNVVALCPNDHRRAHFASDAQEVRQRLLECVHSATAPGSERSAALI